ncbi:MAG: stage V sporulation protein AC [Lachnospiraceae bacterium]|nr:stage V sporulation protein AC [Lachnospiraceae bacterium]
MKKEPTKDAYNEYVEEITPTANVWLNCLKAFITGGIICTLGQIIKNLILYYTTISEMQAGLWVTIILVFLSVLLTGLNVYPSIANWGGAGALVPITGFANSVAAPAIEFQKEGQVFGIGVKIFTIAGPVILYGIFSSFIAGLLYWIGMLMGWVH